MKLGELRESIDRLSFQTGLSKEQVKTAYLSYWKYIKNVLEDTDNSVNIFGIGKFYRNSKTDDKIKENKAS